MSVQQIYWPRAGKKGNEVSGIQLSYYRAAADKYMNSNIDNLYDALIITVECDTTATSPLYNGLATFDPEIKYANVTFVSDAGCPIYTAKDPFWMFNWRIVGFIFSMLTGVIFLFAGRILWKLVHFITGFGLMLIIFWIILYPAYGKKGFRVDWMLWLCYPVTFIFSGLFGFFLTHFPRGGCIWIAGWAGYVVGANLIYDNTFAYVD